MTDIHGSDICITDITNEEFLETFGDMTVKEYIQSIMEHQKSQIQNNAENQIRILSEKSQIVIENIESMFNQPEGEPTLK